MTLKEELRQEFMNLPSIQEEVIERALEQHFRATEFDLNESNLSMVKFCTEALLRLRKADSVFQLIEQETIKIQSIKIKET